MIGNLVFVCSVVLSRVFSFLYLLYFDKHMIITGAPGANGAVSGVHVDRQRDGHLAHCRQASAGYREEVPRLCFYEGHARVPAVLQAAETHSD